MTLEACPSPSVARGFVEHAASLRVRRRLIVTIDGPAASGKTSVAHGVARALGLALLDTGSMYRAATALALEHGLDLADEPALADLTRSADLRFDWTKDPPELLAFGTPIAHRLRTDEVNAAVSGVSSLPAVRRVLVERQRRIGEVHTRLVSEGRDQGSVVFFDADVKFFLTASARVRAERRAAQMGRAGQAADVDAIEAALARRDALDSTRPVAPLICPDDAVRVDTDGLDQRGVIVRLVGLIEERAGLAAPA